MRIISLQRTMRGLWRSVVVRAIIIRRFCLNPRAEGEDNRRQEYILNVILLGSIGVLLVMEVLMVWYTIHPGGDYSDGMSLLGFSLFPIFFIGSYTLSRRGFVRLASYVLVLSLFVGNVYAIYRWGIDVPMAIAGYALVIIIASILLGTRFGFIATGCVAASIITSWCVERWGIVVVDPDIFTAGDVVALVLVYGVIMIVASLSNREVENSLFRVRQSEHVLKEERDSLELRVVERTRDLQRAQFEKVENVYRLAEFGELASGLFHDLVNLVTAILLKADIAKTADGNMTESGSSVLEVSMLTSRVKDFTDGMRRQLQNKTSLEFFSINDSISRAVKLLSYGAKSENVQVVIKGVPHAQIFGDPFRFHHVIINLISNAIESYRTIVDARERTVTVSIQKNSSSFSIIVRDGGCGISDDIQGKIFEPFFTTKTGGSGLGIGLAMVKRIIECDFRGTISVVSVLDRGSVFTVIIPVT